MVHVVSMAKVLRVFSLLLIPLILTIAQIRVLRKVGWMVRRTSTIKVSRIYIRVVWYF
jgi:hypothetical protein